MIYDQIPKLSEVLKERNFYDSKSITAVSDLELGELFYRIIKVRILILRTFSLSFTLKNIENMILTIKMYIP